LETSQMTMLASAIFIMMIAAVSAGLYLLPTLIGWARHVPHIGSVAAVNILLGWTLAGWAVALAMALRSASAPLVQVVQNLPPGQPPASPRTLPPPGAAPHRPDRPSRPASPSRPARPSGPAAPARPASQAPPLILPPRQPGRPHQPDEPRQPRGTLRRPAQPRDPGSAGGQDLG